MKSRRKEGGGRREERFLVFSFSYLLTPFF
jgi:hypothetical protein